MKEKSPLVPIDPLKYLANFKIICKPVVTAKAREFLQDEAHDAAT